MSQHQLIGGLQRMNNGRTVVSWWLSICWKSTLSLTMTLTSDSEKFSTIPNHIMNISHKFHWNSSAKYRDIKSRPHCDLDLWPLTLKTFSATSTRTVNICAKFHWDLSTKYRDNASRTAGRTTHKHNAAHLLQWESKKQDTQLVLITSRNINRIFKVLSLLDSAQNLLENDRYISNHTLKALLHHLLKVTIMF